MTLSLHTIAPAPGSAHRKKRIGRGNASGHGTYATRGLKGQKARKGVSNLKRLGMRQVLLRTPKRRGFTSPHPKAQTVALAALGRHFEAGQTVEPATLKKHGLIADATAPVKLLGPGALTVKNLKFKGVKLSASATTAIEAAGGKIV